jgi:hypothetical protein
MGFQVNEGAFPDSCSAVGQQLLELIWFMRSKMHLDARNNCCLLRQKIKTSTTAYLSYD